MAADQLQVAGVAAPQLVRQLDGDLAIRAQYGLYLGTSDCNAVAACGLCHHQLVDRSLQQHDVERTATSSHRIPRTGLARLHRLHGCRIQRKGAGATESIRRRPIRNTAPIN